MKTIVKILIAETLIALLLLVVNTDTKALGINSSNQEIIESSLEVESWMTSDKMWSLDSNIVEAEAELELECWMIDKETWNTENKNDESSLTLKDWMIDSNIWNTI